MPGGVRTSNHVMIISEPYLNHLAVEDLVQKENPLVSVDEREKVQ